MAELAKVMAHPRARGLGLGAAVTKALIDSATQAGIETLQLGVRGNNHLAIELYEDLGFKVWGRLPNVIEVGDERFDDVRMFLELGRPAHLVLRGRLPCGPGASPSRREPQRFRLPLPLAATRGENGGCPAKRGSSWWG
jgi:hypothetical protein